jgi:predicted permease
MSRPPRLAEGLLRALLPADDREEILGDLAEAHELRRRESALAADAWYWAQMLLVPAWLFGAALRGLEVAPAEMKRTVRSLVGSPGFALVAVLSLGLGIGATTSISGALHALLFLELPVERPDELSLIYHTWPDNWEGGQYGSSSHEDEAGEYVYSNISYPAFELAQREAEGWMDLAGYAFIREMSVVPGDGPALAAGGMMVSGSYFSTLRLGMALGRPLTEGDNVPGANSAVLSHSFWLRAFGGDPEIVGRSVQLNGRSFTVVGVAQEGYIGLSPGGFFGPSDVMVPLAASDLFVTLRPPEGETAMTAPLIHWVRLVARVPTDTRPGPLQKSFGSALRSYMVEAGVVAEADADDFEMRFLEGRRGLDSLRADTEGPLRLLTIVVVIVLLIACANLATLLLARGAVKTPEMALRRAIGASKWELARPQMLESLFLGLLGGAVGLASALWAGPLVVSALTRGSGNAAVSFELNWVLMATAAGAGLLAAGLSGWIPAVRAMSADPASQLSARGQGGSANRFRLGRFLIASQIAISVPLVVGAGLFLETLGNLTSIDLGFDPTNLIIFGVDAGHATRDRDEQVVIYHRVLDDLEALNGVQSVSIVENVLVSGWESNSSATVDGESVMLDMNAVSPDFLETMGIELITGRMVDESDGPDQRRVVVVNETAARETFGGNAVGRTFTMNDREVDVVGVVSDTKYSSLKVDVEPGFIDSWRQRTPYTVNFVIRTERSKAEMEPIIRRLVSDADPRLPVTRFRSQGDELESQATRERVFAQLLTLFGGFALLLSCIGLHGVMSFAVAQRRSEMGVRLALGAAPASIVRMVLSQVVRLTVIGLAIGLLLAWRVSPVVDSMLFGVEPGDGRTMVIAAALMAVVALVAGFMPAWKASRVDPLKSLAPSGGS